MNWDRETEIDWDARVSGWIKLADLLDWLLADLAKEELEEFAGELTKRVRRDGSRALFYE